MDWDPIKQCCPWAFSYSVQQDLSKETLPRDQCAWQRTPCHEKTQSPKKYYIPADRYCRHQLLCPGWRYQQNWFWGWASPVLLLARPMEVNSLKDVTWNAVFVGRHWWRIRAGFPNFRGNTTGRIRRKAAHSIHGKRSAGQLCVSNWRVVFSQGDARRGLWRGGPWLSWRSGRQLSTVELSARISPFCTWWWRPWVGTGWWWMSSQAGFLRDACSWWHYWRGSRRIMSMDVLKLWTKVITRTIIWWNTWWCARRYICLWNETCRRAATSWAQTQWFSVALKARDRQGNPWASGSWVWLMFYQKNICVSAAEGTPWMNQFMIWSNFNPRAWSRGPCSVGRVCRCCPYAIWLSISAHGICRKARKRQGAWLEATVQDIMSVCNSRGWAVGFMWSRFFWKKKGLFKTINIITEAEQSRIKKKCIFINWFWSDIR